MERERLNAQLLALQTSIGALNTRLGGFEEDRRNLNKSGIAIYLDVAFFNPSKVLYFSVCTFSQVVKCSY